jgi:glycosyltransferase involved in cell wall biosynthesis
MFISELAGGGAERVVATLANHWARQGWSVTVVTLGPQSRDFYALHPAVGRLALSLTGESGHFLDGIRQNWRRVRALRQVLRQVQPDVALAMMNRSNILLALASAGMKKTVVVGSERCYPPHFPLGRIWHALRKYAYPRLDAVVAQTHECARWIREHVGTSAVPVIPNAACWPLPDNSPILVPDAVVPRARKILLAIGRMSPEKNFEALIDTFAALAGKHPDWDLVILGDGPDRRRLEAKVKKHASGKRIFLPGMAGNIGAWYMRSDLYAMTSLAEGFPNTLAEALAHGLPAVGFDCDTGPRDILRHEVDGLLVPLGDMPVLQAALDRLMGDDCLRRAFAARAVEARERFSMEKITGRWEALFAELLAKKQAPAVARSETIKARCVP